MRNNTSFLTKSYQTSQFPSDAPLFQAVSKQSIPSILKSPKTTLTWVPETGTDQKQRFLQLLFTYLPTNAREAQRELLFTNTSYIPCNQNGSFQSPVLILAYNLQAENLKLSIITFNLGLYLTLYLYFS